MGLFPCDDYRWSAFKTYFVDNFKELGLRHYTCTNIDLGEGAWRYDYDGETETIIPLEDGDFRSEECTKIKDECDIIITNGPFSLFRDMIDWMNGATFKNKDGKWIQDDTQKGK